MCLANQELDLAVHSFDAGIAEAQLDSLQDARFLSPHLVGERLNLWDTAVSCSEEPLLQSRPCLADIGDLEDVAKPFLELISPGQAWLRFGDETELGLLVLRA